MSPWRIRAATPTFSLSTIFAHCPGRDCSRRAVGAHFDSFFGFRSSFGGSSHDREGSDVAIGFLLVLLDSLGEPLVEGSHVSWRGTWHTPSVLNSFLAGQERNHALDTGEEGFPVSVVVHVPDRRRRSTHRFLTCRAHINDRALRHQLLLLFEVGDSGHD